MTRWRRAVAGTVAGVVLAVGLLLPMVGSVGAASSPPTSGTWYVFILTNVASPGNIWIGQLSDFVAMPDTCDWTDGGQCPPDVPVTYTEPVGPVSCQDAVQAYQDQATSPHAAFGGEKVYIFGNSYFVDNLDLTNLDTLCSSSAPSSAPGAVPSAAPLAIGGVSGQAPPQGGSTSGGGGLPIVPIVGLVALAAGLGAVGYTLRGRAAAGAGAATLTAGAPAAPDADPGLANLQAQAPEAVQANLNAEPPSSPPPGSGVQLASVGADRFGGFEDGLSYGEGAGTAGPASQQAYESLVVAQAPAATREAPLVTAPALEEQTRVQPGAAEEESTPPRPRGPEDVLPEGAQRIR
jgi:hypothetical protein